MTDIEIIDSPQLPVPATHTGPAPAAVFLARLAEGSRRSTDQRLRTIVAIVTKCDPRYADIYGFPWQGFDYAAAAAVRAQLATMYAPGSANAVLASLRGVLKECWRLGLMDVERMTRACDIKPVKGRRLPKGRALTAGEMTRLFAICDQTPAGRRNACILAILYSGGLRRSELVALDLEHYAAHDSRISVKHGKGNKDRDIYLAPAHQGRVDAYIEIRGREPGPLLLRSSRAQALLPYRLTDQAIRDILLRLAFKADVPTFAPHDLRRSYISNLLQAGIDLATVQRMAGHSNPSTTSLYDRRPLDRMREAVKVLDL